MVEEYKIWLLRAKSNLSLASAKGDKWIVYEDFCFQAQQAAEKALKALILFYGVEPERTHNLITLIKVLSKYEAIPDKIKSAVSLNDYAVQTRYPGDYTAVTKTEYAKAVRIARACVKWVEKRIKLLEKNRPNLF